MYPIYPAIHFFRHWLHEIDDHSLHSPYLFDLYSRAFRKAGTIPADQEIEELRERHKRDHRAIGGRQFGAGSSIDHGRYPRISRIARFGITRLKYSRLLLTLINHYGLCRIIELGTSLGLNTLYLAKGSKVRQVITFEGNPELADIAHSAFERSAEGKIRLITGDIDETLPDFLKSSGPVDFAFLDANHTAEATLRYFEMLKPRLAPLSILAVDDIYWSKDMTRAWKAISRHPGQGLFLDLFRMGIVINDEQAPSGYYKLAY